MEKIRKYVEGLFEEVPQSKKAKDMKEEMIADLEDKYNDLIKGGEKPTAAYHTVIAGIGDMEELLEDLKEPNVKIINMDAVIKQKKKTAMVVTISIVFFITSLLAAAALDELQTPEFLAPIAFFTLAGIGTCILVYHFLSIPKIDGLEEYLPKKEEIKERNEKKEKIESSVSGVLWLATVTAYLGISFYFGNWAISWIIFLIAATLQGIINLLFNLGE